MRLPAPSPKVMRGGQRTDQGPVASQHASQHYIALDPRGAGDSEGCTSCCAEASRRAYCAACRAEKPYCGTAVRQQQLATGLCTHEVCSWAEDSCAQQPSTSHSDSASYRHAPRHLAKTARLPTEPEVDAAILVDPLHRATAAALPRRVKADNYEMKVTMTVPQRPTLDVARPWSAPW